ncbi:MAG: hypothetical protein F6K62_19820 [Sphaerospermopsis sp. SIO1G2]|nr:hypothetical protein [Sphaerospermopsis sp. SIO1G1]NET73093.1 hypothetical protein [Sphaerospermopsis sp. SIO1G2]
MQFIYPIYTPFYLSNCQACWEFTAVLVKCLFMADDSQHLGQGVEGNNDLRINSLNLLNSKLQLQVNRGRYTGNAVL